MLNAVGKLREGLANVSPDERLAVLDALSEIIGQLDDPIICANPALRPLIVRTLVELPTDAEQAYAALALVEGLPLADDNGLVVDPTRQIHGQPALAAEKKPVEGEPRHDLD